MIGYLKNENNEHSDEINEKEDQTENKWTFSLDNVTLHNLYGVNIIGEEIEIKENSSMKVIIDREKQTATLVNGDKEFTIPRLKYVKSDTYLETIGLEEYDIELDFLADLIEFR